MSVRNLISAKELIARKTPFIALDATWYLPNSNNNAYEEYKAERIPGALFFDLDTVKEKSPFPHMMPTKAHFQSYLGKMGISPSDTVVIYDKQSIFSSPRVHWMFDVFRHPNSLLLDSFAEYKRLGGPLEGGEPLPSRPAVEYSVEGEPLPWISFEQMKEIVTSGSQEYHILDARPGNRFDGSTPEPRPDMPAGHVPGAKSMPFGSILGGENSAFKSDDKIKEMLDTLDVRDGKQVICMCGSGVTACGLKKAIDPFLKTPALIYDGSYAEWAVRAPELVVKS